MGADRHPSNMTVALATGRKASPSAKAASGLQKLPWLEEYDKDSGLSGIRAFLHSALPKLDSTTSTSTQDYSLEASLSA